MVTKTITLKLPEDVYVRLQKAALATKLSLDKMVLRVIQVGSPPDWEDAPAAFHADLAALDRLDDKSLWTIARSRQTGTDFSIYQQLLDKNRKGILSDEESCKLDALRTESDRFMLCKAHAAALLRWRGHQIPPAEKM